MLAIGLFWLGVILVATGILTMFLYMFGQRKLLALISIVLVVPLLIYALFHWSDLSSRKGFYLSLLGVLSVGVSIAGGVLTHLPFLTQHEVVQVLEENIAPPKITPLSNQEQADVAALTVEENYDPLLSGSEYEEVKTKEIMQGSTRKTQPVATPRARYHAVTGEQWAQAINKRVRLSMADGSTVEGVLTDIVGTAVLVESNVDGGVLGLSFKNDDIVAMAVRLENGEQLPIAKGSDTTNEEPMQAANDDVIDAVVDELPVLEPVVPAAPTLSDGMQSDIGVEEIEAQIDAEAAQPLLEEVEAGEPEAEVMQPEIREIEEADKLQDAANDAAKQLENMVDDSHATGSSIGGQ